MTEGFSYIPRKVDHAQYARELAFMNGTPDITSKQVEGDGDEIMLSNGRIIKKARQPVDPATERRMRPKPGEGYENYLSRIQRLHTGVAQPSGILFTEGAKDIADLAPIRIRPNTYFRELLGE